MDSGIRGTTLLYSGCPQESVSATFTGTSGIHEFQFRSGFYQAVHVPWEDMDYDYNHDYYLLARERDRLGVVDFMISDHPFQRQPSITDFYNPTHPAYLV